MCKIKLLEQNQTVSLTLLRLVSEVAFVKTLEYLLQNTLKSKQLAKYCFTIYKLRLSITVGRGVRRIYKATYIYTYVYVSTNWQQAGSSPEGFF